MQPYNRLMEELLRNRKNKLSSFGIWRIVLMNWNILGCWCLRGMPEIGPYSRETDEECYGSAFAHHSVTVYTCVCV